MAAMEHLDRLRAYVATSGNDVLIPFVENMHIKLYKLPACYFCPVNNLEFFFCAAYASLCKTSSS